MRNSRPCCTVALLDFVAFVCRDLDSVQPFFCCADEQDPRDRDAKTKADRYRAASDEQDREENRDKDRDTEERDVRAMALPAEAILDDTTPAAAYRDKEKERESKDAAGDRPVGIDSDVALVSAHFEL